MVYAIQLAKYCTMTAARPVALLCCGSFNPPTYMHLRMFERARDHVQNVLLKPVVSGFISPTHDGYGKPGLATAEHRVNMVKLALANSDWIRCDNWESGQPEWSRTLQVAKHLQNILDKEFSSRKRSSVDTTPSASKKSSHNDKSHSESNYSVDSNGTNSKPFKESPQLMLLCGADLLETFFKPGVWKDEDLECIVRDFGLIVITRAGSQPQQLIHKSDILTKYQRNIHVVNEWIPNEVSSSSIRKCLYRGESVKYLLPDNVLQYINTNGLYSNNSRGWSYNAREDDWEDEVLIIEDTQFTSDTDTLHAGSIPIARFLVEKVTSFNSDQPDFTVTSPPCCCKSPDPTLDGSSSLVWQVSPETVPMVTVSQDTVWHDSPASTIPRSRRLVDDKSEDVACQSDSGLPVMSRFKNKPRLSTGSETMDASLFNVSKLRQQTQKCIQSKQRNIVGFYTKAEFAPSGRNDAKIPLKLDKPTWVFDPSVTKSLPDIYSLSQNLPAQNAVSTENDLNPQINHLHLRVKTLKISASPETTV